MERNFKVYSKSSYIKRFQTSKATLDWGKRRNLESDIRHQLVIKERSSSGHFKILKNT